MKRNISAILIILLVSSLLIACSDKPSRTNKNDDEEIELTTSNIDDYIGLQGDFVDGDYTTGYVNCATSTLEIEAYPLEEGRFEDVEITVVCTSTDHGFTYMNQLGNYWHLASATSDDERDEIRITLSIRPNGEFERSYAVECLNNTSCLDAPCDFDIVSVSGTFIPED